MTSKLRDLSIFQIIGIGTLTAMYLIAFSIIYRDYEEHHFQYQLKKHLAKNQDETLIKDVTNFDWDVVCHLAAHTENWQRKGSVGNFPIKKGARVPTFTKDDQWGLAFVKDGHMIKAYEVKIPHDVHPKGFCINGTTAIFKKVATKEGDVYHFMERTEANQYSHVVNQN